MNTQFHINPRALTRPHLHVVPAQTRRPAPQPVMPLGFTRRELRRLVAEMID